MREGRIAREGMSGAISSRTCAARVTIPPENSNQNHEHNQGGNSPRRQGAIGSSHWPPRSNVFRLGELQVGELLCIGLGGGRGHCRAGVGGSFESCWAAFLASARRDRRGWCRGVLGIELCLAQGRQILGYSLFIVEPEMAGVGADESFIKDTAGKLIEAFVFDGFEHARADLGDVGNVIERVATPLALFAELVSEGSHSDSAGGAVSARTRTEIIIGQG